MTTQVFQCGGKNCPKGGEHSWDGEGVIYTTTCPECADVATPDCERCNNTREIPTGESTTCSKCGMDMMSWCLWNGP